MQLTTTRAGWLQPLKSGSTPFRPISATARAIDLGRNPSYTQEQESRDSEACSNNREGVGQYCAIDRLVEYPYRRCHEQEPDSATCKRPQTATEFRHALLAFKHCSDNANYSLTRG